MHHQETEGQKEELCIKYDDSWDVWFTVVGVSFDAIFA